MSAIERCRSAALGGHLERCDSCGLERVAYNSCRNRHCPKCQSLARAQWLEQRRAELLPVEYFHVVFTVPEPLAAVAYQNKKVVYGILFRAAGETWYPAAGSPEAPTGGSPADPASFSLSACSPACFAACSCNIFERRLMPANCSSFPLWIHLTTLILLPSI
jgi:hypothetical protein